MQRNVHHPINIVNAKNVVLILKEKVQSATRIGILTAHLSAYSFACQKWNGRQKGSNQRLFKPMTFSNSTLLASGSVLA